MNELNE